MLNNPLLQVWLSCVKKIKPVHSIPGRLRVNIYGIRQYPELAQEYASVLLDKTRHLPGVQSAELSVLTGNILLTYDVRVTTEHELLERLNTAWTALMQYFRDVDQPEMIVPEAIARVLDRVWNPPRTSRQ